MAKKRRFKADDVIWTFNKSSVDADIIGPLTVVEVYTGDCIWDYRTMAKDGWSTYYLGENHCGATRKEAVDLWRNYWTETMVEQEKDLTKIKDHLAKPYATKFDVGDEIWTYSRRKPEVIGPFEIDAVLSSKHFHDYRVVYKPTGDLHPIYLRNAHIGTYQEALKLCINYWENRVYELRDQAKELDQEVRMLMQDVE